MEVLYNLRPLDLELERIALKTYVRIKKALPSKIWDGLPTGGGNRLGHIRHWENALNYDNLSTKFCDQDQTTRVRSWVKNFEVMAFETSRNAAQEQYGTWTCYTDGSKLGNSSGYGYLINRFGCTIYQGYDNMGSRASVFMAEVRAITTVAHSLMQCKHQTIEIHSDSQAAITAISSTSISSKTVLECRNLLNRLGSKNKIKIMWVKAHNAHEGNELADKLAKAGANQLIGPPRFRYFEAAASFSQKLLDKSNRKWQKRWAKDPTTCEQSKVFIQEIPKHLNEMSYVLKHSDRITVGILTQFITGHCFNLKYHAFKSKIIPDTVCRHCNDPEAPETPCHLLTTCPALTEARREWFDGQDLLNSGFVWVVPQILGFLRNTDVWGSMTQRL
jgi:ribonuclease HI